MRLGVDIGGTFTDFILFREGKISVHKLPTTVYDQGVAMLQGIKEMGVSPEATIIHGCTVATNAVLEKKGAKTALITTKGFRDVLEIGRQARPKLYDLMVQREPPVVPARWRYEVGERVDYTGKVLQAPSVEEIVEIAKKISEEGIESVAVSFLFSFLHPAHEKLVGEALKAHWEGEFVSLSCEVMPEFREYERTSTVALNAYVMPVINRYLARLQKSLPHGRLRMMQSSGGIISPEMVIQQPVRTVYSGPAGGVVGGFNVARAAGVDHVITFDMGGTSTDVCLCPGRIQETTESNVGGFPIKVSVIDIHTIGAGGGSIARLDPGGALTVGPESAGADPGPICYGKGTEVTVTDANLMLGRILPEHFLGGRMRLDVARCKKGVQRLADQLGTDPVTAAEGVVRVVNSNMVRAIRRVSVERGFDPRDFTLEAFGGAGPQHACDLAEELGIPRVLAPRYPGALCALGLVMADSVKDYSQTVMIPEGEATAQRMGELFAPLVERAMRDMRGEGFPEEKITLLKLLDMRYRGQGYELTVPFEPAARTAPQGKSNLAAIDRFHEAHQVRYGYNTPYRPTEVVNLRIKAIGATEKPELVEEPRGGGDPRAAKVGKTEVIFQSKLFSADLYDRERLKPGNRITGPAIVFQMDSTVLVPPAWVGEVDGFRNILLMHK